MKTTMNERLARAALGAVLMIGGFIFVFPLQMPAFFFGMMLLGIAVDVQATEFSEEDAPAKKAAPQKKGRRRAAS